MHLLLLEGFGSSEGDYYLAVTCETECGSHLPALGGACSGDIMCGRRGPQHLEPRARATHTTRRLRPSRARGLRSLRSLEATDTHTVPSFPRCGQQLEGDTLGAPNALGNGAGDAWSVFLLLALARAI